MTALGDMTRRLALGIGLALAAASSPAVAYEKGAADDPFASFDEPKAKAKKPKAKMKRKKRAKALPDQLVIRPSPQKSQVAPAEPAPEEPAPPRLLDVRAGRFGVHGNLSLGVTYTKVPEEAYARRSGTVTHGEGLLHFDYRAVALHLLGRCEVYGSDRKDPPPTVGRREDEDFNCIFKEAYAELDVSPLRLTAGKYLIDFGQAVLTSPANPSRVGLVQGSPLETKEGIVGAQARFVVAEAFSLFAGGAVSEDELKHPKKKDEEDPALLAKARKDRDDGPFEPRRSFPYGGATLSLERVDLTLIGTVGFGGAALSIQPFDALILYGEGNAYQPADQAVPELYGRREGLFHDALGGFSVSPGGTTYSLAAEYFHNAQGVPGRASEDRYLEAQTYRDGIPRDRVFDFPVASSQTTPIWGPTAFMSRDYAFATLYSSTAAGIQGDVLYSLNDRSARGSLGYKLVNGLPSFGAGWKLGLAWVTYRGERYSEFGAAREFLGRDQWVLSLEM